MVIQGRNSVVLPTDGKQKIGITRSWDACRKTGNGISDCISSKAAQYEPWRKNSILQQELKKGYII